MNKREAVLGILEGSARQEYVPAGFFLHFDSEFHAGRAAVDKHLEFFRYTDMDFVKVQYERTFPRTDTITRPADWAKMPRFDREFFAPQLEVVAGLVEAAKPEALVVVTLYSPFMCAGDYGGPALLTEHLKQDPDAVKKGLDVAAESLMVFVQECIRIGVDGFYHSTQGAESRRFSDPRIFTDYIKPTDLLLMEEINRRCPFNILHICDYHAATYGGYDDLTPFLDYPGHVVNCSLEIGDRAWTGAEIAERFRRPFMGGMDRKGALAHGTEAETREAARAALSAAPRPFLLAADCTVPADTPWANLRAAIEEAHAGTIGNETP